MKTTHAVRIKYITKVAVLAALAAVVMLLKFPLPFTPPFYKIEVSDAIVLIGGFALGPWAAVLIELLKNLLNLLIEGSSTAYVGELANFVMGCALVVPASVIYRYKKSLRAAILGMVVGTVCLTIVGSLLNYFVLVPTYVVMYKMPLDAILEMAMEANGAVTDLKSMIAFAVAPFNLIKGSLCSVLAALLYKRVSGILHK